jgi:predicted nuclease with TOPRIM domain
MATEYDATEFVDTDFQMSKATTNATSALAGALQRAPTREEVDLKVAEAQRKLADLKRAQDDLERERSALEELRRRQSEFHTGRQEMIHHLTRGLGLLEEAEFNSRRDAEQMAKALADLREALAKVEAVHEETWTKDNYSVELTRALTAIENARMEWNSARLKFPVLSGQPKDSGVEAGGESPATGLLATRSFGELCKVGLALTWPLVAMAVLALAVFVGVLLSR